MVLLDLATMAPPEDSATLFVKETCRTVTEAPSAVNTPPSELARLWLASPPTHNNCPVRMLLFGREGGREGKLSNVHGWGRYVCAYNAAPSADLEWEKETLTKLTLERRVVGGGVSSWHNCADILWWCVHGAVVNVHTAADR